MPFNIFKSDDTYSAPNDYIFRYRYLWYKNVLLMNFISMRIIGNHVCLPKDLDFLHGIAIDNKHWNVEGL